MFTRGKNNDNNSINKIKNCEHLQVASLNMNSRSKLHSHPCQPCRQLRRLTAQQGCCIHHDTKSVRNEKREAWFQDARIYKFQALEWLKSKGYSRSEAGKVTTMMNNKPPCLTAELELRFLGLLQKIDDYDETT
ncbi:hypothetical protein GBA52_005184 [Prunus armeniaca]|nr:hypothetical protein GBA52_005184 [Prunus armeniaca]